MNQLVCDTKIIRWLQISAFVIITMWNLNVCSLNIEGLDDSLRLVDGARVIRYRCYVFSTSD